MNLSKRQCECSRRIFDN